MAFPVVAVADPFANLLGRRRRWCRRWLLTLLAALTSTSGPLAE